MGKYEQIQTRKAISSYGGVGSIIETRDGSIIIKPFDEWPFFISIDGNFQEHNNIEDVRFKNRLSKYFINLVFAKNAGASPWSCSPSITILDSPIALPILSKSL